MSDEPTTEQVTRALADSLPEWRRHREVTADEGRVLGECG